MADFGTLFDEHFDVIYSYVAYRVAPDHETAKDITQEVFLAALKGFSAIRRNNKVLPWLRAIARNKVADHYRARQLSARVVDAQTEQALEQRNEVQLGPTERGLVVSRVIQQLPEHVVRLLEDKYIENIPVREMAKQRGLSEKAVESALSRARSAFREVFRRLTSRLEGEA